MNGEKCYATSTGPDRDTQQMDVSKRASVLARSCKTIMRHCESAREVTTALCDRRMVELERYNNRLRV